MVENPYTNKECLTPNLLGYCGNSRCLCLKEAQWEIEHNQPDPHEDTKHLQWIHNRLIEVHGESENVDFLIKMRSVIKKLEGHEKTFNSCNESIETRKIRERKGGKY